jgi:hypothetical protein
MIVHGTTLECFMDLMERIQPELFEKRKALAQLLNVEDSTVRRWFTGAGLPVGMSMINLRYYLDYLGYRVSEVTHLSNLLQDASRLLAFRVLTLEEMAGLTGHETYPDQLLAVLRGARGISSAREASLHEMVDTYRPELEEKLKTVPRLIVVGTAVSEKKVCIGVAKSATPVTAPLVPSPSKSDSGRDERFKGLVINLLDFAQFYADPKVPEEVRDQLRNVVGQENIFNLKNLLSRLCSSKAFSNQ